MYGSSLGNIPLRSSDSISSRLRSQGWILDDSGIRVPLHGRRREKLMSPSQIGHMVPSLPWLLGAGDLGTAESTNLELQFSAPTMGVPQKTWNLKEGERMNRGDI